MRLFLVAALLVCAATPALGQTLSDDERALQLYQNGDLLYEQGRYEEAVLAWEEAYRLSNRARLLYNIANAHERMQNYDKALDALFRYQAFAKPDERERIARRILVIEERQKSAVPDPVPQPDPVGPSPKPVPKPQPKPPKTGRTGTTPGLVLIGVGIASIGSGAALGVVSQGARKNAEELCVTAGEALFCPGESSSLLKQHRTTALIADIGFVVGAIATTAGVVVLATGKKKAADTSLWVGPNEVGVSGHF